MAGERNRSQITNYVCSPTAPNLVSVRDPSALAAEPQRLRLSIPPATCAGTLLHPNTMF